MERGRKDLDMRRRADPAQDVDEAIADALAACESDIDDEGDLDMLSDWLNTCVCEGHVWPYVAEPSDRQPAL